MGQIHLQTSQVFSTMRSGPQFGLSGCAGQEETSTGKSMHVVGYLGSTGELHPPAVHARGDAQLLGALQWTTSAC